MIDAEVEVARVPGDFIRGMPLEVDGVESLPQRILRAVGNSIEPQQPYRLRTPRIDAVVQPAVAGATDDARLGSAWNRSSSSFAFQAFHTRGLVPRMSATVSRYSAARRRSVLTFAANASTTAWSLISCFCAVIDMVRCCSTSHTTSAVSSADKIVLPAETPRVAAPSYGVVAAAPLGDVVEQRGDDQYLRPREVGDQARTQRIFVRVLRLHEAAQVADHHQDVLVDRVDVEQVVLHLSDDAPEHRQVAAEDSVLVHAAQLVRHAARLAQDGRGSARD